MTSFSTLQASGRAVRLARPAQERDHQRLQAKVCTGIDEEEEEEKDSKKIARPFSTGS
jgi:hypothetical protein